MFDLMHTMNRNKEVIIIIPSDRFMLDFYYEGITSENRAVCFSRLTTSLSSRQKTLVFDNMVIIFRKPRISVHEGLRA